jgi:hypothetical protein
VTAPHAATYALLRRTVSQYLDKCGRGYVDLGKLFSFALKKKAGSIGNGNSNGLSVLSVR